MHQHLAHAVFLFQLRPQDESAHELSVRAHAYIVDFAITGDGGHIDKELIRVLSFVRPFSDHAQALMFRVRFCRLTHWLLR